MSKADYIPAAVVSELVECVTTSKYIASSNSNFLSIMGRKNVSPQVHNFIGQLDEEARPNI